MKNCGHLTVICLILVHNVIRRRETNSTTSASMAWHTKPDGIHIKPYYANLLASDLTEHARYLAVRARGSCHDPPPRPWPMRSFFRSRQHSDNRLF